MIFGKRQSKRTLRGCMSRRDPEPDRAIPAGPVSQMLARYAAKRGIPIPPQPPRTPKMEPTTKPFRKSIHVDLTQEAHAALETLHAMYRSRGMLVSKSDVVRALIVNGAENMQEQEKRLEALSPSHK